MNAVLSKYALATLVAGGLGVAATAAPAQAGSMMLGNSGWKASWDPSFEDSSATFVTLTVLAETADAVVLQKVAAFTSGPDQFGLIAPIEINFEQVSATAAKQIVITSEVVWNATGTDWQSFKFIIEDGTTGNAAKDVNFNLDESFYDANPFDASPFSSWSASGITALPQTITFSGGIVADGSTWTPGIGKNPDAGEVVINANPSTTGNTRFVFKEQPIPAAIPLPAAGWMGLSSLAVLGGIGGLRRIRRSIV